MAILHFPQVLTKAQEELDAVVGPNRLPTYEDFDSLPYIQGIVNESLRYRPVAVLGGTPHQVTRDNVYESETGGNWFIPGGATVFANL